MQNKREIPSKVNEKIVIKCLKFSHFGWVYLASNGFGEQTDLHEFYDLSSSIDKVSFKSNSMSLGLVVLEEKMFTCSDILIE